MFAVAKQPVLRKEKHQSQNQLHLLFLVNALVVKPLEIKIKSITANKTNINTAILGLALNVHKPNQEEIKIVIRGKPF